MGMDAFVSYLMVDSIHGNPPAFSFLFWNKGMMTKPRKKDSFFALTPFL
jgi:hypothetical protein